MLICITSEIYINVFCSLKKEEDQAGKEYRMLCLYVLFSCYIYKLFFSRKKVHSVGKYVWNG